MPILRSISFVAVAAALAAASACAQAQGLFRAYLKSTGNDANPCTLVAPCRLLPAALTAIADGGEIWILDSANYNTSTVGIAKSATILAVPGVVGSVVATGGGQAISIATADVRVALRNLVVTRLGTGSSGITMTAGERLSIESCQFFGLTAGAALHVSAPARVKVTDSILRNNSQGVLVENLGTVDIANTTISGHSGAGVFVNAQVVGGTTASLFNVVLVDNNIGARSLSGIENAVARLYVHRTTVAKNTLHGIASEAPTTGVSRVSLGSNLIDRNGTGIYMTGTNGTVLSAGNNDVTDNGTDVTGTITLAGTS